MIPETNGVDDTKIVPAIAGNGACAPAAIAAQLAREFKAPVGVFDPQSRCWVATEGAGEAEFARLDERLVRKSRSSELAAGQVILWRSLEDRGRVWIVMAVTDPQGRGHVAWIGFRDFADSRPRTPACDEDTRDFTREEVSWGPPCPDAALRAWGQEVAGRLRKQQGKATNNGAAPVTSDEESKGVVISRLTRRLRISDPPHLFQTAATTVLRTSLNVGVVAWIPKDVQESVVTSGTIDGFDSQAFRAFPSPSGRESAVVCRDDEPERRGGVPSSVRRYASVAAGSLGCLLAVNPVDDRGFAPADIERMQYVGSLIVAQLHNAKIYADLKELLFGIIRALTAAIDAKDPYTSGHSERVARIAVRLAEELGMPAPKRSDLYLAGLLHDVGKIGIDDGVLKKTGPLTPEEYRRIQAHVEIGVTILKDLKKLHHILPGVRHHHESIDGTGYPDRLSGDSIPMEARILAVADSFDAMSSNRPYRKRLSLTQIDTILQQGRNLQWDPAVIDALFACRSDLEAIRQKGLGESLIGAVDVTLGRN
jgi:putative nucleotidyltransferase with HDIG domain